MSFVVKSPATIVPPGQTVNGLPAEPLLCPLCEYDVRGLPEPRCPECGYRFTWQELTDPARRSHPYLFEHHPERNVWSLARTLRGGLRPARFWSTLYPAQPSRPRRLLTYWGLCALPLLVVVATHAWFITNGLIRESVAAGWRRPTAGVLSRWAVEYDYEAGAYAMVSLMCLAWPWLTLAALLVFQVSLRRARLRWTHVLRCVLYSSDLVLWLALPVGYAILLTWLPRTWPPKNPLAGASLILPLAVWAVLIHRLLAAYRLYLRFDHAVATVVASQVIVALVYWKAWFISQGM